MWVCDRNRSLVNLPVLHDCTVTSVFIKNQCEYKGSEHFFHHWCSVIWGDYHVCVQACMHLFRCACLHVHLMSSCLIHRENVIARCVFPRSRSDICSRLIGSDCFILHHIQVSLRTLTWQKHTSQQHSACILIHAFYFKGVHIFQIHLFALLLFLCLKELLLYLFEQTDLFTVLQKSCRRRCLVWMHHVQRHTNTHRKRGRHVSDTNRLICFLSGPCCDAESPLSRALCDNISPSLRAV